MSNTNDGIVYSFDNVVTLEELERRHIETAMQRAGGNKPTAAAMLGITVKTLYNKLNRYAKESSPDATANRTEVD